MENMLTFTGIVIIVFGILQIILFFKIWGMTNDVKTLKDKFTNSNKTEILWKIRRILLKGDKREVEDLLLDYFIQELKDIKKESNNETFASPEFILDRIKATKAQLKNCYRQIDLPLPASLENINTLQDIENIFKL